MRFLVTGANGFLGSRVVASLRKRGLDVVAMVRSPQSAERLGWTNDSHITVVRADLRQRRSLPDVIKDVDGIIHLAAVVSGGDDDMLAGTVVGTENLLNAMNAAQIKRLVLCSSFSVYNYRKISVGGELSEDSPLLDQPDLYLRNGYSVAKTWQERLARRWAVSQNGQLTVLRPGFIWGPGHEYQPCLGGEIGPIHFPMGINRPIALTYVENCGDAFAAAAADNRSIGQTFNVVDEENVTAYQYTRDYLGSQGKGFMIPTPYRLGFATAVVAQKISKTIYAGKGKLPGYYVPHKFEPRFKPYKVSKDKLSKLLGWKQPVSYAEALNKTFNHTS